MSLINISFLISIITPFPRDYLQLNGQASSLASLDTPLISGKVVFGHNYIPNVKYCESRSIKPAL